MEELKNDKNYQKKWNEILLQHSSVNISLPKEISELLDISLDSAYRRLRNDTDYTLEEAAKIANHFNLPLEILNDQLHSVVSFRTNQMNNDINSYKIYLENMLMNTKRLSHSDNAEIYFGAEDIPVFYHFKLEKLMRFKITYWLKSLMLVPEFQNKNYNQLEIPEEIMRLANEIYEYYTRISSYEIWTTETVMSTIKQIRFYWDAGFFSQLDDVIQICDELESMMHSIQKQAETGYKFNQNGSMTQNRFSLYISDVMIGTNSILAKSTDYAASFISYSTFNFMQTNNLQFNAQNQLWMNNLISRSTLISTVAEKQRNQFFKGVYKQINDLKQYFKDTL